MLLVDADQPEAAHRREDGRARSDDDAGLARGDPLALVAPLRLRQPRVEHGDPVAEAARKRPSACGVSAISGTRTIAPSPRSSAAAQAWR